jgi:hypothetical protein
VRNVPLSKRGMPRPTDYPRVALQGLHKHGRRLLYSNMSTAAKAAHHRCAAAGSAAGLTGCLRLHLGTHSAALDLPHHACATAQQTANRPTGRPRFSECGGWVHVFRLCMRVCAHVWTVHANVSACADCACAWVCTRGHVPLLCLPARVVLGQAVPVAIPAADGLVAVPSTGCTLLLPPVKVALLDAVESLQAPHFLISLLLAA